MLDRETWASPIAPTPGPPVTGSCEFSLLNFSSVLHPLHPTPPPRRLCSGLVFSMEQDDFSRPLRFPRLYPACPSLASTQRQ